MSYDATPAAGSPVFQIVTMHWIAATLAGLGLGLAWFGCVRLRMHFGPILKARYGNHVRRIYWVLTIAAMIVLANLTLLGLRAFLHDPAPPPNQLLLEVWFAVLAVGLAFALIFRRMSH